jgi:hypothetical protein
MTFDFGSCRDRLHGLPPTSAAASASTTTTAAASASATTAAAAEGPAAATATAEGPAAAASAVTTGSARLEAGRATLTVRASAGTVEPLRTAAEGRLTSSAGTPRQVALADSASSRTVRRTAHTSCSICL